ncbi:MAG: hypothetical protein B7X71_03410 [Polynucleobacter sp. 39-46-10]|nr:MAG: hypothetical protein B7Y67_03810 [Polynucleobacter sp. 35-46-11]OZA77856.1 MAG: hypothetical protein B7X71_03410 [Polynucleobacter sp. 39-46-10]
MITQITQKMSPPFPQDSPQKELYPMPLPRQKLPMGHTSHKKLFADLHPAGHSASGLIKMQIRG